MARRTGLAAGTIRMWEQRYGFPEPLRTDSGYRVYPEEQVAMLSHAVELRRGGMSVPAALETAREAKQTSHPSIFGSVPHEGRSRRLKKRTLVALSRAIEDQAMTSASRPLIMGSFQRERHYRGVEHRYHRMAKSADLTIVFADFEHAKPPVSGEPVEVDIPTDAALGHEWAVVVDSAGFSACLSAWEPPVASPPPDEKDRVFEAFWTLDPSVVRQASRSAAACAREAGADVADELEALLRTRPMAPEAASTALESLTARMVAYLETA